MDADLVKAAQARVLRLLSGLEASTGAGWNCIGYFRPDPDVLRAEPALGLG